MFSSLCWFWPATPLCSFGMRDLQDWAQIPTLEFVTVEAAHLNNNIEMLLPFPFLGLFFLFSFLLFFIIFQIVKHCHSLYKLLLYLPWNILYSILIQILTLELVHFLCSNFFSLWTTGLNSSFSQRKKWLKKSPHITIALWHGKNAKRQEITLVHPKELLQRKEPY